MLEQEPRASKNIKASLGADNLKAAVISPALETQVPKLSPEVRDRLRNVLQQKEQDRGRR